MALTGADFRYLRRRKVGSAPDDAELQAIHDAYEADGAYLPLEWVVLDVLERRLADMRRNPAQFAVSGEYSQNTGANIEALEEAIADQKADMIDKGIELDTETGDAMSILEATDPTYVR